MEDEAVLSAPEIQQVEPEKTLTVAQVNDIVKREKAIAAERARKELEARHAEELSRLKGQSQPVSMNNESDLGSQISKQVFNDIMAEAKKYEDAEAKRHQEELERQQIDAAEKLVNKWHSKMALGKEKFNDFEEVMGDFDPRAFPQLVFLTADEENTPDVMYELAKNPQKLASMHILAMTHPALAEKEIKRLAASISQNQQAQRENVSAQAPLSRLKSSQSTGVDSGKMSIADFKNADWLRPTR